MGCISAKITRIGGDLIISVKRQKGDIKCATTRIGGTIKISTSLICAIDPTKKYIRVTPQFIWLTESNNYTEIVNVLSNTDWTIK